MRQSEQLLVAFQYQMRGLRKAHLVLFVTLENSEIDREHRDTETPSEEEKRKKQKKTKEIGQMPENMRLINWAKAVPLLFFNKEDDCPPTFQVF